MDRGQDGLPGGAGHAAQLAQYRVLEFLARRGDDGHAPDRRSAPVDAGDPDLDRFPILIAAG
ncbi:hypothetical protein [Streptomyces sp. NPDC057877]|uniref:hypothetical protein n=1 Tax=Streptomyces sp. NPDC057877 TaxID=3346269 RepID=UPI0036CAD810